MISFAAAAVLLCDAVPQSHHHSNRSISPTRQAGNDQHICGPGSAGINPQIPLAASDVTFRLRPAADPEQPVWKSH